MKGICWFRTPVIPTYCTYLTPNKLYMNTRWDDKSEHQGWIIADDGDEIQIFPRGDTAHRCQWEVLRLSELGELL